MLEVAMDLLKLAGGGLMWILAVGSFGLFRYFLHRMKWSWALTGHMVLTVVAGSVFVAAAVEIRNTYTHSGPGGILVGYDDHSEIVSEERYKENQYWMNGIMLITSLIGWCFIAKFEDCKKVAAEAKIAMHEAETNRLRAYISAIECQIESDVWNAALKQARESPNYLSAAELAERARAKLSVAEREV